MKIGIVKETTDKRIALIPATIQKIHKDLGGEVWLEKGAGLTASFPDSAYEGVKLGTREEVLKQAELLCSVHPLPAADLQLLGKGTHLISLFQPYNDDQIAGDLQKQGFEAFSLDMIPRTTLAQSMDVLSSMASIAGYRAVLSAAQHLPRYLPMMITAAGSIRPAKVLVLGAGVAGLQAIATARRLGAVVEAFDVRKAAREEVESLGAKFVEVEGAKDDSAAGGYAVEQSEEFIKRQKAEVQARAAKADILITTAQVRGRKAPILVTAQTIGQMKPGSVVVDLAASTGGNCELTQDDKIIQHNGVTIIGNSHLAADMAQDASVLFSNNLYNFMKLLFQDGKLVADADNEIVRSAWITRQAEEAVE
ncbi:MAG: Re/Si-specific NAD(P)(+) transhydrogenase subunit alpha [Bacteroidota bacterium]